MTWLDWVVLAGTLAFIVGYGIWRTRGASDVQAFFHGGYTARWPAIGLGIMATQASAITFLSTPGQAFEDGMRFVQFYFGLPLAMIVICAVFVPMYHRLRVVTAYEYLERRFDVRVRWLGAALFLVQRGLAAGITIYAPAIILSSALGWSIGPTNLILGLAVIAYTVSGGVRAVSETQKQQMVVMLVGLGLAVVAVVWRLPESVSLSSAVRLAGALDRMNIVSFELDPSSRYNFWSGITGGFFLALSYFGTDQSQVQRYLSGRSVAESRLGLIFNGMFKIPMQLVILFAGVMVFVFHLFEAPPLFFNDAVMAKVAGGAAAPRLEALEQRHELAFEERRRAATAYVESLEAGPAAQAEAKLRLRDAARESARVRDEVKQLVAEVVPGADVRDSDYVFIRFVLRYLPSGLVGLLVAMVLCASMSSTASELAALGSTTTVDLYQRARGAAQAPKRELLVSKLFTAGWGGIAILFATFAAQLENLIQAVNIVGSIFYGTVLGLFLVAFFVRSVTATPVIIGAVVAQLTVFILFAASDLGFLWYNVVGCTIVVVVSWIAERVRGGLGGAPEPDSPPG